MQHYILHCGAFTFTTTYLNTPSIPAASTQTHGADALCVSPGRCHVLATEGRCYGGLTAPERSRGPSSRWTQFEQVERRTGRQAGSAAV